MTWFSWLDRVRRAAVIPIADIVAPDPRVRRVLVTGAAGTVAAQILPLIRTLAPHWRLTDARATMPSTFGETRVQWLGRGRSSDGLFDGVDAVVHLAGQAKPASPDVLRERNIDTVEWLLTEMQGTGITRLVYASSMHIMGRYRRDDRVTPDLEPRPSDAYGASKLAAEQLIQAATQRWGLRALVLRMGHVTPDVASAEPTNWLAADDLARLISVGLHRTPVGVHIVHAVTPHAGDDMGQADTAARFGMVWRRDAPSYRLAMHRIARWYGEDTVARELRGGVFASGRA